MTPIIFPYNIGSRGARLLAEALNTRRVRANGNFVVGERHCIINWGNATPPRWREQRVGTVYTIANPYAAVGVAANKLRTFRAFAEASVPHPEWTADRNRATDFFGRNGRGRVVCRQLLRASEGRGIVVAERADQMVQAPLYVKYFPKETEYRVHVFNGEVIDVVQKRLRNGARQEAGHNQYIRSHDNGWIFARENVHLPESARGISCDAIRALRLTFGAVDLAVNLEGVVKVFEVNTAPGIEGTTVQRYADAIRRYCRAV